MQKLQGKKSLSTRLINKEEKLVKILDSIAEESKSGIPIIVEGKNDIKTLRKLGISGPIISVKTKGKSFFDVVSEIQKTDCLEVILLLDFDKRGKQGTKYLQESLEHIKVKYNITYWRKLMALTGREIQYIETLNVYLHNLHKRITKNNLVIDKSKLFENPFSN
jgi:2,5-diamino-6-(ribosylamino)-4(3H)-pyrimidinone 5'-phosphate reductase